MFKEKLTIMWKLSFLVAFAKLRIANTSFFMTVCLSVYLSVSVRPPVRPSASNNSPPTERIFMKFGI